MRRGRREWGVLVFMPVVALLVTGSALAQDAREEEVSTPRVVSPAECVTDPLPFETLVNLLRLDADGVPAPAHGMISAPLGEVADVAIKLSINEATRQLLACFNAGDIPRAAALMTDYGVQRAYWRLTGDPAARGAMKARLAAAPRPRPEAAQLRLIAVTDTSFLPDGRAVAFAVLNDPLLPPSGPETLLFYFSNQDDKWLVDDWVGFSIVPVATEATPAP